MCKPVLIEFRCSRPNMYPSDTDGHLDLSKRSAYTINAVSEAAAIYRMKQLFPEDTHFDIEVIRSFE